MSKAKKPATAKKAKNPAAAALPEGANRRGGTGRQLRVEATKMGYFDHARRRPGDVFDVFENEFSANWMKVVDGSTPPKTTGAQAALTAQREQHLKNVLDSKNGAKSTGDKGVI